MLYLFALLPVLANSWTLKDTYQGTNFFGQFDFFTASDPTHGYVDYVSQSEAQSQGLINVTSTKIYMGADHTNIASGSGRKSVRITSRTVYNTPSLFILDLSHMPACCGCWPGMFPDFIILYFICYAYINIHKYSYHTAYWLVGPSCSQTVLSITLSVFILYSFLLAGEY